MRMVVNRAGWEVWDLDLEQVSQGGCPLSHTINMFLKAKVNVICVLCHRSVTDCFAERLEPKNTRINSKQIPKEFKLPIFLCIKCGPHCIYGL